MKFSQLNEEKQHRPTFRFYYKDGNQQMFEADNMYDALSYVLFERKQYNASDIYKIEEVEDDKNLNGNYFGIFENSASSKGAKIAEGYRMADTIDEVTIDVVDCNTGEILNSWKTHRPSYYIDKAHQQYLVADVDKDVDNNLITVHVIQ